MKIGPMMKLLLITTFFINIAQATETPATRAAELVKQDQWQAALAKNPALAQLAQQIVKQVRK